MWYSHIDPEATVEIVNTLRDRAAARETVFYDIYTDAEKNADHAKEDTGLFFFKGEAGKPFAVCNAGGAFANADELEVSTDCYSLWGGSAGARMAAYLGPWARRPSVGRTCQSPGPLPCSIPGTANTIPPTFAVAGDNDGIASWRTMERRIDALSGMGVDTEFHHYSGLGHGFGLGSGTNAEGWFDLAVRFWEKQM